MGVRVNEKTLEEHDVTLKLWDIAGEIQQQKVPKIYFAKKNVILYIVDITRPFTFRNILEDVRYLKENAGYSIIKIVGNKKDLLDEMDLLKVQQEELPVTLDEVISAKTGENIIALFNKLVEEVLTKSKNT